MKRSASLATVGLGALVATLALAAASWAGDLTSDSALAADVAVTNVATSGDLVSGTIVNRTRKELKDVQLLVTRAWLWKDERNPGAINPGGSYTLTVPGPIPPSGSLPFSFKMPVADGPADLGSFETTVHTLGFTEVGRP